MVNRTPVVIGMGAIGPGYNNVDEFKDLLFSDKVGNFREITHYPLEKHLVKIAAEVDDNGDEKRIADLEFLLNTIEPAKNAPEDWQRSLTQAWKRMDRFSKLALKAGVEAMQGVSGKINHSYIPDEKTFMEIVANPDTIQGLQRVLTTSNNVPVIVGSGFFGFNTSADSELTYHSRGPSRVPPTNIQETMPNNASARLAILYQFDGPNYGVSSACASSNHAIMAAAEMIENGKADYAVVLNTETLIRGSTVASFENVKALTANYNDKPEKASRPWDLDRSGFTMGEGASAVVLGAKYLVEELEIDPLADVVGYGASDDISWNLGKLSEPNVVGPALAMLRAINHADLLSEDGLQTITYVNAHGTSTPVGDLNEARAIASVLGKSSPRLAVTSTKSKTGHQLGNAGGIEAIATILTLAEKQIGPNVNLDKLDPQIKETGLYFPTSKIELPRPQNGGLVVAISNSFGFGGTNSAIAFREAYKP